MTRLDPTGACSGSGCAFWDDRTLSDITTESSIVIDGPIENVWAALTTPELIKQWFFGVDTESDWTAGSPIVSRSEWQGKSRLDKGVTLTIEPRHQLVHTHWSDQSGLPDRPENYQEVTWRLEERGGSTTVTVSERNVPSEEAKAISDQGWGVALTALKSLLEAG